jgi:hypothetical protein
MRWVRFVLFRFQSQLNSRERRQAMKVRTNVKAGGDGSPITVGGGGG